MKEHGEANRKKNDKYNKNLMATYFLDMNEIKIQQRKMKKKKKA